VFLGELRDRLALGRRRLGGDGVLPRLLDRAVFSGGLPDLPDRAPVKSILCVEFVWEVKKRPHVRMRRRPVFDASDRFVRLREPGWNLGTLPCSLVLPDHFADKCRLRRPRPSRPRMSA
jgi:hypothetical protein